MRPEDLENEEIFTRTFEKLFEYIRTTKGACAEAEALLGDPTDSLSQEAKSELKAHLHLCGQCQWIKARLDAEWDEREQKAALRDWSAVDRRLDQGMHAFLQSKTAAPVKEGWISRRLKDLNAKNLFGLNGLAYALSVLFLVATPIFIYEIVRLQKAMDAQTAQTRAAREKNEALNKRLGELAAQEQQRAQQMAAVVDSLKPKNPIYANPFSYVVNVTARRSAAAPKAARIQLPADAQILNLVINLDDSQRYPSYRVEIRADSGKLLFESDHLKKDGYGSLQLAIPKSALAAQSYVMKIYGAAPGGQDHLVAEHPLSISF